MSKPLKVPLLSFMSSELVSETGDAAREATCSTDTDGTLSILLLSALGINPFSLMHLAGRPLLHSQLVNDWAARFSANSFSISAFRALIACRYLKWRVQI